ncbi:hypothetical protein BBK82_29590 [Lentzea guizhouensis]|uniref:AMP-dependent synthetase/ligase domain-containing protein n=1 Tax=Lentzea guizhouensis TaxID=1586287 RepID=A0A1B2HPD4_9PSEU|nr:AMP-binding protein [Lentzea guizhouensis]ANZ39584.1 hypothetical protein BBK82_29590 [Lentzea guizhouensis]
MKAVAELLADNAGRRGDRPAYTDDRRTVTWAELEDRTARLASGLNVDRGARVAILLDDGAGVVEAVLATTRAAAVGVLLSPHSTAAELEHLLEDSAPDLLITSERHLPKITNGPPVVLLDEIEAGERQPRDDLGLDEPAWLIYTSGTTGAPKAAVSTQRAALWSPFECYGGMLGLSDQDDE